MSRNLPRIYVALDYDRADQADRLVDQLPSKGCGLKVGKELFTAVGPQWITRRVVEGYSVFLDLKYHDIPNTVGKACRVAAGLGVDILNVHASGGRQMMEAAKAAVESENPRAALIAVTVLTSMTDEDLNEVGVAGMAAEQVERLGRLTEAAGLDGVVCSGWEAATMRQIFGSQGLLVTPGIRPSSADAGDQRRVMTPIQALTAGASALVIGRPITQASDPAAALDAILAEIG